MRSARGMGIVGLVLALVLSAGCSFDAAGVGSGGGGADDGDGAGGVDAGGPVSATADASVEPAGAADAAPASGVADAAPPPPPPDPPPGPPPISLPAACDLVTQSGCAAGLGCHLFDDGAFCSPAGDGAEGNLCWNSEGCRRGLDCVDPGTGIGGICAQLCWDSSVCAALTGTCTAFSPSIEVGGREIGFCF